MKKIHIPLIMIIFLSLTHFGNAQEVFYHSSEEFKNEKKLRPFRIGVKAGFPNLIGGNIEYVTPLGPNRLALTLDHSVIKTDWLESVVEDFDGQVNFKYFEGGLNYYFFQPGRGLYGGVSYSILRLQGNHYYSNSQEVLNLLHDSFNVKLGARLGGLFYIRPEIGYSFTPFPDSYRVNVIYMDGRTESYTREFALEGAELIYKGLIATIGIGFAF